MTIAVVRSQAPTPPPPPWLSRRQAVAWAAAVVVCFHLAYVFAPLAGLMAVAMFGLYRLAYLRSSRVALYGGIAMGLVMYGPHLWWFWPQPPMFGPAAVLLWTAMGVPLAMYLLASRWALATLPRRLTPWLIPFFWTGVEFFRCELNPLKFAWLMPAWAFDGCAAVLPLRFCGAYGLAFVFMLAVAVLMQLSRRWSLPLGAAGLLTLGVLTNLPRDAGVSPALCVPLTKPSKNAKSSSPDAGKMPAGREGETPSTHPLIVCVQMEDEGLYEILAACDRAIEQWPDADIIAFSEYALEDPPPRKLLEWCRDHGRYVILGGRESIPERPSDAGGTPSPRGEFYNMAYVVGPGGIEHRQAKSVPVQFFRDGLPAPSRSVWASPWGPVGVCICYDMSYAIVVDDFVRQGARLLVVPTMDRIEWSESMHRLHARVTPVRAAEYGLPIVRPCSSGISQIVLADGTPVATLGFPGQGEMMAARIPLDNPPPTLPPDRYLAPAATAVTVLSVVAAGFAGLARRWRRWCNATSTS